MYRGVALVILSLIILIMIMRPKKEHANLVAPGVYNRDEISVSVMRTSGAQDMAKKDIRFGGL